MRPYRRMWIIEINNQRGIILPMVLLMVFIFSLAAAGLALYSGTISKQIAREKNHIRTFYMAEAATERSVASIKLFLQKKGRVPTPLDPEWNQIKSVPNGGAWFTYSGGTMNITQLGNVNKTLTTGNYKGLNGSVQTFAISVTANDGPGNGADSVTMTQQIEIQQIPVFQFGVFYQNDLEILPGPNMSFIGPVHSNAGIYLGTDNTLSFDSSITAHGNINHGRKDSSVAMNGNVMIKDSSDVYQNMKNSGGGWLDHSTSDWSTLSQSRWNGNVADSAQSVPALNLPIPSASSPHTLVERQVGGEPAQIQSQKMDYKAQIRILDGIVYDANGSSLELRYCSGGGALSAGVCPQGQTVVNPILNKTFKNFREGRTIKSTDIDMGLLNNSPAFKALANANNGIILYSSDRRDSGSTTVEDALRLVNGSALINKGMTVATENPLYVKGDYNTVNKQPSGIISDAFNILSNSWSDANSTNSSIASRTAAATTIQTAVITGNTTTSTGNYNGGLENIPRFLETWNGKTLTYKGSIVVLYNSQVATGNWIYGSPYYEAPIRSWSFDTSFSNPSYNIPGFPSVYTVVKSDWKVQ